MATFRLKTIKFNGKTFPIIMQNENGPCPLLAISNVLLCRGKINIHPDFSHISSEELYVLLGDYLIKSSETSMPKEKHLQANHEQNVADAIATLPQLLIGLDVNVRFRNPTDFEFTSNCIIFDLLEINLVHGWLMDPQEPWTQTIGSLSYNHLVEKAILHSHRPDPTKSSPEGEMAERFLQQTASQLTYHGLVSLRNTLKEGELCVFFRNNHFSTLLKNKGELYLLVTDLGYLHEPHLVWEKLTRIDGDSIFVDNDFNIYDHATAAEKPPIVAESPTAQRNDTDLDFALAMQLQQEEEQQQEEMRRQAQSGRNANPPMRQQQQPQPQQQQQQEECVIS
eukprot:TRINITY_DN5153_c0_g1_i1.p1 TRINITY_DN5153_c0_g1~~TRINITY_DN5153_c0_g1_i1.p1  ORF type:complete len:338 (-),score=78.12 TRINITY_DN5153_c0_g1_i1:40-1053(-)